MDRVSFKERVLGFCLKQNTFLAFVRLLLFSPPSCAVSDYISGQFSWSMNIIKFVSLLVTIPNFPLHFLSVSAVEDDVIAQLLRAVVPPSAAWGFAGPISGPWVIASRSFSLVVIQFPLGFTVCISCVWVLSCCCCFLFLFFLTVCISCVLVCCLFLLSAFPVCGLSS